MSDRHTMTSQEGRLLSRGVAEIIVKEEMIQLLRTGKKLRLKEGFDPSFPDIHLGHMVALRKLRQFQELGHQVVLIALRLPGKLPQLIQACLHLLIVPLCL